jgi:hypothetical protein
VSHVCRVYRGLCVGPVMTWDMYCLGTCTDLYTWRVWACSCSCSAAVVHVECFLGGFCCWVQLCGLQSAATVLPRDASTGCVCVCLNLGAARTLMPGDSLYPYAQGQPVPHRAVALGAG